MFLVLSTAWVEGSVADMDAKPATRILKSDDDLTPDQVKGISTPPRPLPVRTGQLLELVRQHHDAGLVGCTRVCLCQQEKWMFERLMFDCRPAKELCWPPPVFDLATPPALCRVWSCDCPGEHTWLTC